MRKSGVLMPVFSLPDKYGRGSFSEEAYNFIDKLSVAGQKYWQILPITSQGKGNSPYSPISCFAGEASYIDPDALVKKGLLTEEEFLSFVTLETIPAEEKAKKGFSLFKRKDDEEEAKESVRTVIKSIDKEAMLRRAFKNGTENPFPSFTEYEVSFKTFCKNHADWLDDYAMYKTLRNHYQGKPWSEWPEPIKTRKPAAVAEVKEKLASEIEYHKWIQFEFNDQWQDLRRYAHDKDIDIIGDIPIYASYESSDCWANPVYFKLDEELKPITVSGCPPDDFTRDGQVWETPVYNWDEIRESGYSWWIARLRRMFELYDVVRLDHARAFESFFEIPSESMDAKDGHWSKGPGLEFFTAVKEALPGCRLIAEDLGIITDEVRAMIKASGVPNMNVVQHAFDTDSSNPYIPENVIENSVIYTGTHDNDTTVGWYGSISEKTRANVNGYAIPHLGRDIFDRTDSKELPRVIADLLVRLAMESRAETCIIPIQDYLLLGSEARVNVPGAPDGNWKWQLAPGAFDDSVVRKIRDLTIASSRL